MTAGSLFSFGRILCWDQVTRLLAAKRGNFTHLERSLLAHIVQLKVDCLLSWSSIGKHLKASIIVFAAIATLSSYVVVY